MRVRYTRRSQADVLAIFRYLDQRSPQGSSNVKRALKKTIDLIGAFPHHGRPSGEQNTHVILVRGYPYLIYWGIESGEVVNRSRPPRSSYPLEGRTLNPAFKTESRR